MTKQTLLSVILALAIGLGCGFWLAGGLTPMTNLPTIAERQPLYYRHPMNPQVTSPTPAKDEMGMDYLPVYAEQSSAPGEASGKGRVLYYRHPMGAADTSPLPKKDEMGMDYLPVYEGELPSSGQIRINPEKIQKLGVKAETVGYRSMARTIRALGSVQVDEGRVHVVSARFEGWVQHLRVNSTGQSIKRGQPLLDIYSPDLLAAQQEYLIAKQGEQLLQQASPQALATAQLLTRNALQRLSYWEIGQNQLQNLQNRQMVMQTLQLSSPVTGVVLQKPAVEGMRFMPGEMLFQIADLSKVWLVVDVFEQDLDWIKPGQPVAVHINAYPQQTFKGSLHFINPTLNTETRSVKVRVELDNQQGLLKPGLYGSVELIAGQQAQQQLAVPDSAVLDSGTRQVVLVQLADGLFEPRKVKLGRQADGYSEILQGVAEGEKVVVRANFLIDAESNLNAALEGMSSSPAPSEPQAEAQGGEH
jgi:Cu(I)/Ag(I) efflux system membrane fusion protein